MYFIGVCHPRRRRRRRSRSISDICPFRPADRSVPVDLVVRGHRRFQVVRQDRAGPSVPVVRVHHHFRAIQERRAGRVDLDHRVRPVLLASMLRFVLAHRDHQRGQLVQLLRVDQVVLSVQVRRVAHQNRVVQVYPALRGRQAIQVVQVDQAGLVGRVCMAAVLRVRMVQSAVDRDFPVFQVHPVCLVCPVFPVHHSRRVVLANSIHRIGLQY